MQHVDKTSRTLIKLSNHFIKVMSWWARWRLKSPASRLFAEPFIQAQIKENIKAPRHRPLWGEYEGNPPVTGGFRSQRASNTENVSIWYQNQLEQLEHPRCEDTPTASWLPIFILDPKSKQDEVKVTNLKNLPKFQILEFLSKLYKQHTF